MIHWIATAFSTYVLHPLRGNGYQWWSGVAGDLTVFGAMITLLLKHNCYEHRCWRVARMLGEDGHHRCKRHHTAT